MGYIANQFKQQKKAKPSPLANIPVVGALDKFGQAASDVAVGAAKGAVSTFKGTADLGEKLFNPITNFLTGSKPVGKATDIIPQEAYTPSNTAQKIGFGAEQIAEFVAPASKFAKAEKALDIAVQGSKLSRGLKVATKVIGKAGIEAGTGGGISLVQSGGDLKEAAKTAATFGAIKGATGVIGETARAFRLPERLYSTVFKNTYRDAFATLKQQGIQNIAKNNPTLFTELKEAGIIKTGLGGKFRIDESLAKKALDRGLKGSLNNMANVVVEDMLKAEKGIRTITKTTTKQVAIPEKAYGKVFRDIAQEYEGVEFGNISRKAFRLAREAEKGKISAETALEMRRFLDGLRIPSSYNTVNPPKMSLSQSNLKALSDRLRGRLNAIPGIKQYMNKYSFSIDALESIAREASRRGNQQVVGYIDTALVGGGLISGEPIVASLGFIKRQLNNPAVTTRIGQAINKGGQISKAGAAIKGAVSKILP